MENKNRESCILTARGDAIFANYARFLFLFCPITTSQIGVHLHLGAMKGRKTTRMQACSWPAFAGESVIRRHVPLLPLAGLNSSLNKLLALLLTTIATCETNSSTIAR